MGDCRADYCTRAVIQSVKTTWPPGDRSADCPKSPDRTTCAYGRDTYREICRRECASPSGRVHGSAANFVPRGILGGRNFCRANARRNGFPLKRSSKNDRGLLRGESKPRSGGYAYRDVTGKNSRSCSPARRWAARLCTWGSRGIRSSGSRGGCWGRRWS